MHGGLTSLSQWGTWRSVHIIGDLADRHLIGIKSLSSERFLHTSDRSIVNFLLALPPAPGLPLFLQASPKPSKYEKGEERRWGQGERLCFVLRAHGLAVQGRWQPSEGGLFGEFQSLRPHSRAGRQHEGLFLEPGAWWEGLEGVTEDTWLFLHLSLMHKTSLDHWPTLKPQQNHCASPSQPPHNVPN